MDLVDILTNKESMDNQVLRNHSQIKLNNVVKLGKYKVGDNFPTYIIAEAGLNHNGSIEIAKKLIDEAKKAGCNSVKFQSFSANSRVSKNVKSVK